MIRRQYYVALAVLAIAVVVTLSGSTLAQQSDEPEKPEASAHNRALIGLEGVKISVKLQSKDKNATGLTEAQLERTLKAALLGGSTVSIIEGSYLFTPEIYLHVLLMHHEHPPGTVSSIVLYLREPVQTFRHYVWAQAEEPVWVWQAVTWQPGGFISTAPDDEAAREIKSQVRDMVDEFTIAWHEANPQGEE